MSDSINRRIFLQASAVAGAALSMTGSAGAANDKIVVGIMGMGGRGNDHVRTFGQEKNVEIAYVCDVDEKRAHAAVELAGKHGHKPQAVGDFRRILDDKAVDVLVVATCNHWHAPAAILGCQAGKHVYVEKPCSHNPYEGELMVEAARKHKRLVQMGNQRRSMPKVIEAIEQVRQGVLGRAYYAQSWYWNTRASIGRGKEMPTPEGLNYDLWQGPAPHRPFHTNYLHYNWHWFWHWGNGELGNNGIHFIDLCRWGLGVDYPIQVCSAGGRYRYEDDQETPDTHTVTYTFDGRKSITWEGFSCNQGPEPRPGDVVFYGEKGSLAIHGSGYTIHDPKGKELRKVSGPGSDSLHIGNFLDAIRTGKALNSPIEEGHKSTLLCHLGNIAHRTRRTLLCEPERGHIVHDKEAMTLWRREYEPKWEPKV